MLCVGAAIAAVCGFLLLASVYYNWWNFDLGEYANGVGLVLFLGIVLFAGGSFAFIGSALAFYCPLQ